MRNPSDVISRRSCFLYCCNVGLFSIALSIPDTAASLEAIKILQESSELVDRLWDNVNFIKTQFMELGFDIGHSETPITPVMIFDEEKAKIFSAKLFEMDVFATPIIFPMVSKGKARIRVIPSAAHSREDLEKGIAAFKKVKEDLGI